MQRQLGDIFGLLAVHLATLLLSVQSFAQHEVLVGSEQRAVAIEDSILMAGPIIYFRSNGIFHEWVQTADISSGTSGEFGYDVALSGAFALIGDPGDNLAAIHAGAARVFEQKDGTWLEVAVLRASDAQGGDRFGESVSMNNSIVVVGASDNDDLGISSGSSYVFENIDGTWTETAKLLAPDGSARALFGFDVWAGDEWIAIGAPGESEHGENAGAVYLYQRWQSTWSFHSKIVAPNPQPFDRFGRSVGGHGHTVVVGAPFSDPNGRDSGSVYTFAEEEGVWNFQQVLAPLDGVTELAFGWSVDVEMDFMAVGSRGSHLPGIIDGSVYVFEHRQGNWVEYSRWFPSTGKLSQHQPYVSISNRHVAARGEQGTYVVDFSKVVSSVDTVSKSNVSSEGVSAYPNPFSWSTVIKFKARTTGLALISFIDMMGKTAQTDRVFVSSTGEYMVSFRPNSNLSAGIYAFRISMGRDVHFGTVIYTGE